MWLKNKSATNKKEQSISVRNSTIHFKYEHLHFSLFSERSFVPKSKDIPESENVVMLFGGLTLLISSRNLSQDFPITFGLNKETLYTHHVEKLHRTYVGKTLNFCKNIVGIERNGKWRTKFSKLKSFKTFKAYNINHNSN